VVREPSQPANECREKEALVAADCAGRFRTGRTSSERAFA